MPTSIASLPDIMQSLDQIEELGIRPLKPLLLCCEYRKWLNDEAIESISS